MEKKVYDCMMWCGIVAGILKVKKKKER